MTHDHHHNNNCDMQCLPPWIGTYGCSTVTHLICKTQTRRIRPGALQLLGMVVSDSVDGFWKQMRWEVDVKRMDLHSRKFRPHAFHPGNTALYCKLNQLTYPLKYNDWKSTLLLGWSLFRGYLKLQGCIRWEVDNFCLSPFRIMKCEKVEIYHMIPPNKNL